MLPLLGRVLRQRWHVCMPMFSTTSQTQSANFSSHRGSCGYYCYLCGGWSYYTCHRWVRSRNNFRGIRIHCCDGCCCLRGFCPHKYVSFWSFNVSILFWSYDRNVSLALAIMLPWPLIHRTLLPYLQVWLLLLAACSWEPWLSFESDLYYS